MTSSRIPHTITMADDCLNIVIGAKRWARSIRVWRVLLRSANIEGALAGKRQAGTHVLFLGVTLLATAMLAYVPEIKRLRTLLALATLLAGTLCKEDARKLFGMLVHLTFLQPTGKQASAGLWGCLAQARADPVRLGEDEREVAAQWHQLLTDCAAAHMDAGTRRKHRSSRVVPGAATSTNQSDAYITDHVSGGIGGYAHGTWWHMDLYGALLRGPISAGELLAFYVHLIINAASHSAAAAVDHFVDNMNAFQAMAREGAKAPFNRWLYREIVGTPAFRAVADKLRIAQRWGVWLLLADAASRGYRNVIDGVADKAKVTFTEAAIPQEAMDAVAKAERAMNRLLDDGGEPTRASRAPGPVPPLAAIVAIPAALAMAVPPEDGGEPIGFPCVPVITVFAGVMMVVAFGVLAGRQGFGATKGKMRSVSFLRRVMWKDGAAEQQLEVWVDGSAVPSPPASPPGNAQLRQQRSGFSGHRQQFYGSEVCDLTASASERALVKVRRVGDVIEYATLVRRNVNGGAYHLLRAPGGAEREEPAHNVLEWNALDAAPPSCVWCGNPHLESQCEWYDDDDDVRCSVHVCLGYTTCPVFPNAGSWACTCAMPHRELDEGGDDIMSASPGMPDDVWPMMWNVDVNMYYIDLASRKCTYGDPVLVGLQGAVFVALRQETSGEDLRYFGVALPDYRKHFVPTMVLVSVQDTALLVTPDPPVAMRAYVAEFRSIAAVAFAYAQALDDGAARRRWRECLRNDVGDGRTGWARLYPQGLGYSRYCRSSFELQMAAKVEVASQQPDGVYPGDNHNPILRHDAIAVAPDIGAPQCNGCACHKHSPFEPCQLPVERGSRYCAGCQPTECDHLCLCVCPKRGLCQQACGDFVRQVERPWYEVGPAPSPATSDVLQPAGPAVAPAQPAAVEPSPTGGTALESPDAAAELEMAAAVFADAPYEEYEDEAFGDTPQSASTLLTPTPPPSPPAARRPTRGLARPRTVPTVLLLALILVYLVGVGAAVSSPPTVVILTAVGVHARPPSKQQLTEISAALAATAAAAAVVTVLAARSANARLWPRTTIRRPAGVRKVTRVARLVPAARPTPKVTATSVRSGQRAAAQVFCAATMATTDAYATRGLQPPDGGTYYRNMLSTARQYIERGVNVNTRAGEVSAWHKYYLPYCKLVGAAPWRNFEAARGPVGEAELTCGLAVHTWINMRPRKRTDPAPRVDSVRNVLSHIRRRHDRAGFPTAPWKMVRHLLKGMAVQRIADYGLALPVRAEPFTAEENIAMKSLPARVGRRAYDPRSRFWASWRMIDTYADQAGPRKSEVVGNSDIRFVRADVQCTVDGVTYPDPGPEVLKAFVDGRDRVTVAVNVSKADFDGTRFGNSLVSLLYNSKNPMSFAAAWVAYELLFPLRGRARYVTPLFTTDGVTPWTADLVDRTLSDVMHATLTPQQRKAKTFHSKRVWVATGLHALHSSTGEIQAFVRWGCEESVRIYARLDLNYQAQRRDKLQYAHVTAMNAVRRELIEPTLDECGALGELEAPSE